MRIAILEAQKIAGYEIEMLALPLMFPDAEITGIQPKHISPHGLAQYDLLILPGINGLDSPYPDILPARKKEVLENAIQNNGLILWTECAATYYLFEEYRFAKANDHIKERYGLGILKGRADGPAFAEMTHSNPPSSDKFISKFKHHVVADIESSKNHLPYQALDVNGPALYPSSDNLPFSEIFKYAGMPKKPICGLIQERGRGLLMAFSFHAAMPFTALPFIHHGREESRTTFLQHKTNLIRRHLAPNQG